MIVISEFLASSETDRESANLPDEKLLHQLQYREMPSLLTDKLASFPGAFSTSSQGTRQLAHLMQADSSRSHLGVNPLLS